MKTYLSIDIGTSSTKLTLVDENGAVLVSRFASYPIVFPNPDWAEQAPQDWWSAVCSLGRGLLDEANQPELRAICVSGQAPSCVPIDAEGRPLRPAILWLDRRATHQVDWLRQTIGEDTALINSGNRLDSYFGGVKWLWYKQNEPDLFARTWKILQANSYILYQLTGQAVVDPSQAGLCSPCFNLSTGTWDESICQAMGLPLALLPDIRPSAEVIGQVTPAAAQATGLPEGTPVVCGGGDYACACLGAGVTEKGQAAMMLGTAGNLLFPAAPRSDPRLLQTYHLTGEPLTFGGVFAGGALNWFTAMLGIDEPRLVVRLDEEASQVPPGADGLVFLPYLMGERTPIWDPGARGAFIGLSNRHQRGHLFRAVLEGVAFAFRQITDIMAETGGHLDEVVALDGGARSPLWLQIFADVLKLPIRRGGSRSGTALGSAFLAALGVGDIGCNLSLTGSTAYNAIQDWVEYLGESYPRPEVSRRYDQLYQVYRGLYPKLKADFEVLVEVETQRLMSRR
jgi:xylulokinase